MLFFLISCLSLILFYMSLPLKPLEPWASEVRLLTPWFWKDLSHFFSLSMKHSLNSVVFTLNPTRMSLKKKRVFHIVENNEEMSGKMSVLDLPDLALECILEKLPPNGLCRMACVCTSLKDRCMSDHLWERHMRNKWGGIVGPAAYRIWRDRFASRKDRSFLEASREGGLMFFFSLLCPRWLVGSDTNRNIARKNFAPVNSIMSWYFALETGEFWFPAQVYNRENGHVGFMLSCYDAELSYDSRTDTFQARYPPHGRRAVALENGVTWDRLRAPPMDTSPHVLHISDCLNELCPGDHIEIQWRRNKEFPYGWWYGVVGHMESCDGNEIYCLCHESDTVVLEFNQYTLGSRWRCTYINRKDHREEGNEADGFYGGIRKLNQNDEISTWKRLWPNNVLE